MGEYVFHLSPAQVGYYFALPSIGYLLGNAISGRKAAQLGMNRMILMGATLCVVALSAALLADLADIVNPFIFFGSIAVMGIGNGMVLPSANAGMMSVRPQLAGTASGLGGALTIAGGAAMAALAGAMLKPGAGATPLLIIMALSATGSVASILRVMRREAALRRSG